MARQLLDALNEAQDLDQFEANWAVKQVRTIGHIKKDHATSSKREACSALFSNLSKSGQENYVAMSSKRPTPSFGLTRYSDISNNRRGTAIYFQKRILPIRSY